MTRGRYVPWPPGGGSKTRGIVAGQALRLCVWKEMWVVQTGFILTDFPLAIIDCCYSALYSFHSHIWYVADSDDNVLLNVICGQLRTGVHKNHGCFQNDMRGGLQFNVVVYMKSGRRKTQIIIE